jgi:hypothetical protein
LGRRRSKQWQVSSAAQFRGKGWALAWDWRESVFSLFCKSPVGEFEKAFSRWFLDCVRVH